MDKKNIEGDMDLGITMDCPVIALWGLASNVSQVVAISMCKHGI